MTRILVLLLVGILCSPRTFSRGGVSFETSRITFRAGAQRLWNRCELPFSSPGLRAHGFVESREKVTTALGKMAGCLFGSGLVLTVALLLGVSLQTA